MLCALLLTVMVGATAGKSMARHTEPKAIEASDTLQARDVFANIPLNVLDLLDRSTRLSMLIYWDMDSVWKAPNAMEGLSHLDSVTPNYLKVSLTDVSSLQIKLLPYKKGKLIMTIYNIGEPDSGDSDIRFFNSDYTQLPGKKFKEETELKEFFNIPKGSLTSMKEIYNMIPFYTTVFYADPDNNTLTGRLTLGDYVNTDDLNIVKLFMRPCAIYDWNGSKFRLRK